MIQSASTGQYLFKVTSDDGAKLFVNGELVVDNDGLHRATSVEGSIELTSGDFMLELHYFQVVWCAGSSRSSACGLDSPMDFKRVLLLNKAHTSPFQAEDDTSALSVQWSKPGDSDFSPLTAASLKYPQSAPAQPGVPELSSEAVPSKALVAHFQVPACWCCDICAADVLSLLTRDHTLPGGWCPPEHLPRPHGLGHGR